MTSLVHRLCLALTALFLIAVPARAADRAPVILISIDGFRADYATRGLTPTLAALAAEGGWAREGMRPSFPVNTFPNHYTLVTGLRPDQHGITDNTLFDAARPGVKFNMYARDQVEDRFWWDGGEPVWVTAERAGIKTATMFWPGSEAPVRGVRPTIWFPYQESLAAFDRVDRLLGWLDRPRRDRPRFMTLYFEAVDTVGHRVGPDGADLNAALVETDAALARLVAGLKARGLYGKVNLVVVADHGMAPVARERSVFLDDLVPGGGVRSITLGSVAGLIAETPAAEAALLGKHDHVECWRKADLPARFHYGTHPRIPPIICLSETGWVLTTRESFARSAGTKRAGAHGFDPDAVEMRALFIVHGPAFRPGVILPVFDNVSVYPLVMTLLGLTPRPNDGTLRDTALALK